MCQGRTGIEHSRRTKVNQERRQLLDTYARTGFFTLDQDLIDELHKAVFIWSGDWAHPKDLIHFDLEGW
jgi:hypothetical protein